MVPVRGPPGGVALGGPAAEAVPWKGVQVVPAGAGMEPPEEPSGSRGCGSSEQGGGRTRPPSPPQGPRWGRDPHTPPGSGRAHPAPRDPLGSSRAMTEAPGRGEPGRIHFL